MKKTSASTFPSVLRWQVRSAAVVTSAACDEAWTAARTYRDDELAALVLTRPECSQELLTQAATHTAPAVRARLLVRPDLTSEMLTALLTSERRASVLGEVLAAGSHPAEVGARAAAVFAEKPTIALATELVRAPQVDATTRVEAALLLLPRFRTLTHGLQANLRTLPDRVLDPAALTRLVLATTDPDILMRAVRTGRCTPAAQLHAADLVVGTRIRHVTDPARPAISVWQTRTLLNSLTSALADLANQPQPAPGLAAVAELARSWGPLAQHPDAQNPLTRLAALAAGAPRREFAELAAQALASADPALARSLLLDPGCPAEVLVPLPALLAARQLPSEVFEAMRARAGQDALLVALARVLPGQFLHHLGWEVFADPAAAEAAVLGAVQARDVISLERLAPALTPSQARLLAWPALREHAARRWFPDGTSAVASATLAAQAAALGSRRDRWEVFASLASDHTGTLGELLDACSLVLGEIPDEIPDEVSAGTPAGVSAPEVSAPEGSAAAS